MRNIAVYIILAGLLVFSLLGYLIGDFLEKVHFLIFPACMAVIWCALYVSIGFRMPEEKTFLVIERFGRYYRIAHAGLTVLCFPGLVDKIVKEGSLRSQKLELFKRSGGPKPEIDFTDATAPIAAQAWYQIGDPKVTSVEQTDKDILLYAYCVESPEERMETILDAVARPILQCQSYDEAQKNDQTVNSKVLEEESARSALRAMGIYLAPDKGYLITDIGITEEIKALRRKLMEGEKEAEQTEKKGAGYANAILAIMKTANEGKEDKDKITFEQARQIYETQVALETVKNTSSNITFFASDVPGVLKTLNVGKSGGGK